MSSTPYSRDPADAAERASRTLQQLHRTQQTLKSQLAKDARRYGITVVCTCLAQLVVGAMIGLWLYYAWSWNSLVFLAICEALLAWFATRADARNWRIIPHPYRSVETFSTAWGRVAAGLLLTFYAGRIGLPASFDAAHVCRLGWPAAAAGILLMAAVLPRCIFGLLLIWYGGRK